MTEITAATEENAVTAVDGTVVQTAAANVRIVMETEMETAMTETTVANAVTAMTETTAANAEIEIMTVAATETSSPEARVRVRAETEMTVTTETDQETVAKAARTDAAVHPVREEAMTDRLFPRWKPNRTRKILKNVIITKKKEINSPN